MDSFTRLDRSRSLWSPRVSSYMLACLVSTVGTWMQQAALEWLVIQQGYQSSTVLGEVISLQLLPFALLAFSGGILADWCDRNRLLLVLELLLFTVSLSFGLIIMIYSINLWEICTFGIVIGSLAAIQCPVHAAYLGDLVRRDLLGSAVAVNLVQFNLSRTAGPAIAGVIIGLHSVGFVFVCNAACSMCVVMQLLLFRGRELPEQDRSARPAAAMQMLSMLRGSKDVVLVLALIFVVCGFGYNFATSLPYVSTELFGKNPISFGFLVATFGMGSAFGAFILFWLDRWLVVSLPLCIFSAGSFGVMQLMLVGAARERWVFVVLLFAVGAAASFFLALTAIFIQQAFKSSEHGKAMSLYSVCYFGGTPIGALLTGWLADEFGCLSPFVVEGFLVALSAIFCMMLFRVFDFGRLRVVNTVAGASECRGMSISSLATIELVADSEKAV